MIFNVECVWHSTNTLPRGTRNPLCTHTKSNKTYTTLSCGETVHVYSRVIVVIVIKTEYKKVNTFSLYYSSNTKRGNPEEKDRVLVVQDHSNTQVNLRMKIGVVNKDYCSSLM